MKARFSQPRWTARTFGDKHDDSKWQRFKMSNVLGADGRIICTFHKSVYDHRSNAEIDANAALISAAPELYYSACHVIAEYAELSKEIGVNLEAAERFRAFIGAMRELSVAVNYAERDVRTTKG